MWWSKQARADWHPMTPAARGTWRRQCGTPQDDERKTCLLRVGAVAREERPRQAKIRDFDLARAHVHQHVLWLEVAVHHAVGVCVPHARQQLVHHRLRAEQPRLAWAHRQWGRPGRAGWELAGVVGIAQPPPHTHTRQAGHTRPCTRRPPRTLMRGMPDASGWWSR